MRALLVTCLLLSLAALAHGQAMVEYGHAVARGGLAGAAGGKKTGQATGAVFDRTTKALDKAGKSGAAARPVTAANAKAQPKEEKKPAEEKPATASASIPKKASIRISQ